MFKSVTPEKAGISSDEVLGFLRRLDKSGLCTHSIIMARGNNIFAEAYYKPFSADFKHRMYSVSKSFVAIAIGFLEQEGLLCLDDKFMKYFSGYENENVNEYLKEVTIREMLTMETAVFEAPFWFYKNTEDRAAVYFEEPADKIPGTLFHYDSPGSYMLGVIVEKVTGKPFLEFLQEKVLNEIGFSKDAYCLKTPGGYSFSDSGVMCTTRDLLTFARFVLNYGVWEGKRYLNEKFIKEATSRQVCNNNEGITCFNRYGYGYQIWKAPNDGFAFIGMGDQFAICDPKTDFIFVITSDNQGNSPATRTILYHELYNNIIPELKDEIPEDITAYKKLEDYCKTRKLFSFGKSEDNSFESEIENVTYALSENPMGIKTVRFNFEDGRGKLTYENAQGEKELIFGMGYNEFGFFPEEGYSDLTAGAKCEGNKYRCACSGDWAEHKKLRIKVQIIDKYFGNACFVFSFKDERVAVSMMKTAEAFLDEYSGRATGRAV